MNHFLSWALIPPALAAALVLAACNGGGPEPPAAEEATATPTTPTAVATPETPTEAPATATAAPEEGAGGLLGSLLRSQQALEGIQTFSAELTLDGQVQGESFGVAANVQVGGPEAFHLVATLDIPEAVESGFGRFEVLLTEGRLFVLFGEGPWFELPSTEELGFDVSELGSLGQLSPELIQAFTQLLALLEIDDLGVEDVAGHPSTHYQISADLQTFFPAVTELFAGGLLGGFAPVGGDLTGLEVPDLEGVEGQFVLDLWLDQESDLLRRLEASLDAAGPDEFGVQQTVRFLLSADVAYDEASGLPQQISARLEGEAPGETGAPVSLTIDFLMTFDFTSPVQIPAVPADTVPFDPSTLGL